jgi:hypothetical protein
VGWFRPRGAFFLAGTVAGAGLALIPMAVDRYIDGALYGRTDPGGRVWTCAGATGSSSILYDRGSVVVVVTIADEAARAWQVGFPGYEGSTWDLEPSRDGTYPAVLEQLTDLDDGPRRTVTIRPSNAESWCEMTISLR